MASPPVRIAVTIAAAVSAFVLLIAAAATVVLGGRLFGTSTTPSTTVRQDVPPRMLTLYLQASATCPGLDWAVLAAIGKVETDHACLPNMVSTQAACATAGIRLARTAQAQYNSTPKVPRSRPLHPGDLVFYGRPGHIHHVGLYIDNNGATPGPTRPTAHPTGRHTPWPHAIAVDNATRAATVKHLAAEHRSAPGRTTHPPDPQPAPSPTPRHTPPERMNDHSAPPRGARSLAAGPSEPSALGERHAYPAI